MSVDYILSPYFIISTNNTRSTLIKPRHEGRAVLAFAKRKDSGEPSHLRSLARTYVFVDVSGTAWGNFSPKTRHVTSLRGWACALKD